MTTVLSIRALTPYRLALKFSGTWGGMDSASNYALVDGATLGARQTIDGAWLTSTAEVELSLAAPLVLGESYIVTTASAGNSPAFELQRVPATTTSARAAVDAEAEAYGIDWDLWSDLDGAGDIRAISGLALFREELVLLARLRVGDLFHDPTAGVNITSTVNGPSTPSDRAMRAAKLRRAYLEDPRAQTVRVTETHDNGTTWYKVDVRTVASQRVDEIKVQD